MTFSLSGKLNGLNVSVTWADGKVTGDPILIGVALAYANQGALVTIAGCTSGRATLRDPALFSATIRDLLDNGKMTWTGDALTWPELPEGAVA